MHNKLLIPDNVRLMLREKGNICISVIVPTHRLGPGRREDPLQLERATKQAKQYLLSNHADKEVQALTIAIDELARQVDFTHNAEGVGLFVSPGYKQLVHFLFPVKEKVIIGDSFEITDILYQASYDVPFFVLLLSENEVKLFKRGLDSLSEVNDGNFPMKYVEEFEYAKAARGNAASGASFVRQFEKDTSALKAIRTEAFFRQADTLLKNYTGKNDLVILCGVDKDLMHFQRITQHTGNIAGEMPGNYFHIHVNELAALCREVVKSSIDEEKEKVIKEFEEKIGGHRGITGLQEIWRAAVEGRAFKLLVEKDFSMPGFITGKDAGHLYLLPPLEPHRIIPNAINELVITVLEKNGQVVLIENGALENYEKIALITRF